MSRQENEKMKRKTRSYIARASQRECPLIEGMRDERGKYAQGEKSKIEGSTSVPALKEEGNHIPIFFYFLSLSLSLPSLFLP